MQNSRRSPLATPGALVTLVGVALAVAAAASASASTANSPVPLPLTTLQQSSSTTGSVASSSTSLSPSTSSIASSSSTTLAQSQTQTTAKPPHTSGTPPSDAKHPQLAAASARSDSIDWSFGGWNPVEHANKLAAAAANKTRAPGHAHHHSRQQQHQPQPQQRPRAPSGDETPSSAASDQHRQVHLAGAQRPAQHQFRANPDPNPNHGHNQFAATQGSQHLNALVSGQQMQPAYELSPSPFSAPAMAPIVRDRLLPARHLSPTFPHGGQHGRVLDYQGAHQPRQQYPTGNQQQQPHPHMMMLMAANARQHHERNLQRHHEHLQRHRLMMQQFNRQHYHQQPAGTQLGANSAQVNRYRPAQQLYPPVLQQHQQQSMMQPEHSMHLASMRETSGFRLVEGQQPTMFTIDAPIMGPSWRPTNATLGRRLPGHPIEPQQPQPGARDPRRYPSQAQPQPQQQSARGNNIQDIKYQLGATAEPAAPPLANGTLGRQQQSKYLTIPVAVETEGDKVLTPDDISEIERHVINVLPNLKTGNKVVKLADSQLSSHIDSQIRSAVESQQQHQHSSDATSGSPPQSQSYSQPEQPLPVEPSEKINDSHYADHQTTLKQLEGDAPQAAAAPQQGYQTPHQQQQHQHQATTPFVAHRPSESEYQRPREQPHQAQRHHQAERHPQQQQPLEPDTHYLAAVGPVQELDADQVPELELIKSDLLNNIRYEPTRASSAAPSQFPRATPPMPLANVRPHAAPKVSRYFHHHQLPQPQQQQQYRARDQHPQQQQQQQGYHQQNHAHSHGQDSPTATTRHLLGGRKVSEVMRPLIRTTPVPMTSPLHVASVEPEKLDAIQLIAGQGASTQAGQTMVVEAHQLVNHTPDGGIDYASGSPPTTPSMFETTYPQQQQQQPQHQPQHHQQSSRPSSFDEPSPTSGEQQQHYEHQQQHSQNQGEQQQQQQPQYQLQNQDQNHHQQQQVSQRPPESQQEHQQQHMVGPQQGAVVEYVAIGEQTPSHQQQLEMQHQQQPEGQHEQHPQQQHPQQQQQEMQTVYVNAEEVQPAEEPQGQERPVEQQQQTFAAYEMLGGAQTSPAAPYFEVKTTVGGEAPPAFTWSPSIASEHQQQQHFEFVEHQPNPIQQLEMPATAGYNTQMFLNQPSNQDNSNQDEQSSAKWRSKAGGSQPNPDAQYDGQIVKSSADDSHDSSSSSSSPVDSSEPQAIANYLTNHQAQHQAQNQNQNHAEEHTSSSSRPSDEYHDQQQQQLRNHDLQSQQPGHQMSTMSFMAGAQINHPTGSHLSNRAHQQQQQQASEGHDATMTTLALGGHEARPTTVHAQLGYVKLDMDAHERHLARQQASYQAQMADLSKQAGREQQQQELPTTPMSPSHVGQEATTRSPVEAHQQQQVSNYKTEASAALEEQAVEHHQPIGVPVLDQQSLIPSGDTETGSLHSSGEDVGSRHPTLNSAVYQVYQAYYAPKDHKPLPGYVRLSIDEFNDLFKDAEIQYVDKNQQQQVASNRHGLVSTTPAMTQQVNHNASYETADMMLGGASERHDDTIVIDRRSMLGRFGEDSSDSDRKSLGKSPKLNSITQIRPIIRFSDNAIVKSSNLTSKFMTSHYEFPIGNPKASNDTLKQTVRRIISIKRARQTPMLGVASSSPSPQSSAEPATVTAASSSTTTTTSAAPTSKSQLPSTSTPSLPVTSTTVTTSRPTTSTLSSTLSSSSSSTKLLPISVKSMKNLQQQKPTTSKSTKQQHQPSKTSKV